MWNYCISRKFQRVVKLVILSKIDRLKWWLNRYTKCQCLAFFRVLKWPLKGWFLLKIDRFKSGFGHVRVKWSIANNSMWLPYSVSESMYWSSKRNISGRLNSKMVALSWRYHVMSDIAHWLVSDWNNSERWLDNRFQLCCRTLACPRRKDDTQILEALHIF